MEDCEICNKYKEHCYWKHQGLKGKKFYEVMKGDFSNQMKIPKKFSEHFTGELAQIVTLKSPIGKSWQVGLTRTDNEMSFESGWNEFVKDNHIQEGDLLIFKCSGDSCFKISIFCDHCQRAPPCMLNNGNFKTRQKSENSVEQLDVETHNEVTSISSDDTRQSSAFSEENCRAPKKYARAGVSCKKIITRSNYPSTDRKKNLNQAGRMKNIKQESYGNRGFETLYHPNIYLPFNGKRLSGAEESKALMLVKSLRSRNPCFISVIHATHVGTGSFLGVPSRFAENHLPPQNVKVSLSIPGRREKWHVSYNAYNAGNVTPSGFRGKWKSFACENHLERGDVCLFELIKKHGDFMMKVHIARLDT